MHQPGILAGEMRDWMNSSWEEVSEAVARNIGSQALTEFLDCSEISN